MKKRGLIFNKTLVLALSLILVFEIIALGFDYNFESTGNLVKKIVGTDTSGVKTATTQITTPKVNTPTQPNIPPETTTQIKSDDDIISGEFIVKFKSSSSFKKNIASATATGLSSIDSLNKKNGVQKIEKLVANVKGIDKVGLNRIHKFYVDEKTDLKSLILNYQLDPNVEYAEPVYKPIPLSEPNDPYYSSYGSWNQSYSDQWWIHLINANYGWIYSNGSGVIVGDMSYDPTFDMTHLELVGKSLINLDEIPNNKIDDDNDGQTDNVYYRCGNNPCNINSGLPHETAGVGLITANTNNIEGIASIAFGSKVISDDHFSFGFSEGAKIWYHSWTGRSNYNEDELQYVYDNGGLTFVAAGNLNAYTTLLGTLPTTINVGSVDPQDSRYWSSGWGDTLDVVAPGADILTIGTLKGYPINGQYTRVTGTSFAAPITAGLGALLLSYKPSLTPGQLRYIILNSVVDKGDPGWDPYYGYGRIDVKKAFEIATSNKTIPSWDFESKIVDPRWNKVFNINSGEIIIKGTANSLNFKNYSLEICRHTSYGRNFYTQDFKLVNCTKMFSSNKSVINNILGKISIEGVIKEGDFKYRDETIYLFLLLKINDNKIPYYKPYITSFGIYRPAINCGDLDNDPLHIDFGDFSYLNDIVNLNYTKPLNWRNGDMNGDGKLDSVDVKIMSDYMFSITNVKPTCQPNMYCGTTPKDQCVNYKVCDGVNFVSDCLTCGCDPGSSCQKVAGYFKCVAPSTADRNVNPEG
ncbi:MAG: S8 family serine peptidase [Nanoarchaeota archaeon]